MQTFKGPTTVRRTLTAIILLFGLISTGEVGWAGSDATLMIGSPSVGGVISVMRGSAKVGELWLAVQADGRTVTTAGPPSGGWFEALYIDSSDDANTRAFRGVPSGASFSPSTGGTFQLNLGSLGTARVTLSPIRPYGIPIVGTNEYFSFPVACMGLSYRSDRRSWGTNLTIRDPIINEATGSLGAWDLRGSPPDFPGADPLLWTGSLGLARHSGSSQETLGPSIGVGGCA